MKRAASAWKVLLCVVAVAVVAGRLPANAAEPAAEPVDYNRDIRPLLSDNCYKCHGPDAKEQKAGLRLDTHAGATAELESGVAAIAPGSRDESELFFRITSEDNVDRMPPPATGKKLTPEQIELLGRWIDDGANYQQHWSFIAPQRPEPPKVNGEPLVRNDVDRFVLARLEKAGLSLSSEADKITLIRRATFDLTGMPPTPAEVDAFLADESPEAYERLVDRLLASPRYGEHMARYWLDAVRYADTHGLHFDNERSIWKYRDWVVQAFNDNKRFDEFTVEQIAGDLLPNPTLEQKVATGFGRCLMTTNEGGSIDEETLVRYGVDRTEAVGTVWLGLTVQCAVCHDHKFDPISQKDFYRLYAFFNSTADAPMDGNLMAPAPVMKLPSAEQTAKLAALDQQIGETRATIAAELAKIEYVEPPAAAQPAPAEPQEYVWIEDEIPTGGQQQGDSPWEFVSAPDHPVFSGQKSHRRTAQGRSQHFFTGANPGLRIGEGDKLFAYAYLDPANPPKSIMLQFNDGAWEHRVFWGDDLIPFGASGTPSRLAMGPLPAIGQWARLEVDAAKVNLPPGAVLNGWAFTQHDGTVHWDKAGIVTRTPQGEGFNSLLAWESYERTQKDSKLPGGVQAALKVEPDQRSEEQKQRIRDHFFENVYSPTRATFAPFHKQIEDLNKQRGEVDKDIATTLVMAEMERPRDTFVLVRGQYDQKAEHVTAGVPAVLPPLPAGASANRLGLAKWLVDPAHPLTARVTVNRFWQQYFGRGIVKTAEDFGSQGEWPTHPELLDWLATDFVQSGWDVKRLQKRIVMSATYRQSSRIKPALLTRDPENGLLARGPRFRLDAEVVRDTALAASGLLVEQRGGRSVKPYQPPGLWEAVGFVGSNTREYKPDAGEALYRRSMYTFWKRTSPPPSLITFDAPSRETCVVRRARTNTPLQALALMNDEQYVEASRRLAQRMMTEGGATQYEQLTLGFRLVTARKPQQEEVDVLLAGYEEQLAHYRKDIEAAKKLISVGASLRNESLDPAEHAAWTMTANLLLNLDETVTKE